MLKKSRKESELNTVESQIRGLETRLKYNKSDLVATVSIFLRIQILHIDVSTVPSWYSFLNSILYFLEKANRRIGS